MTRRIGAKSPPVVLYEKDGILIADWAHVSITIWGSAATVAVCDKLDELSTAVLRTRPQGGSAIHMVLEGAPLPGPEARARLADLTERYGPHLACVGTVLEGTGFWASTLQSLIISISALANRRFKSRTASTIGEIARWVPEHHAKRTGIILSPSEIERVLVGLRAQLVANYAPRQRAMSG